MLTDEEAARLEGATMVAGDGGELGTVETVLTHAADNRATWAAVDTGERVVLVSLDGAAVDGDRLVVRNGADQITSDVRAAWPAAPRARRRPPPLRRASPSRGAG